MHLDAVALAIVERAVAKVFELEIAVELAIDARKQIEIELRGQAGGVIVSGVEDAGVLHQVDPDDQRCAASQHAPGVTQERGGFVRLEIADGRSGEESGMSHPRPAAGNEKGWVKSASTGSTARRG